MVLHTFFRSNVIAAAVVGVLAAALAWSSSMLPAGMITALEHGPYDYWVRNRSAVPVSTDVVVIARDPASESRFGRSAWDRAVLGRAIIALRNAGAAVLGLNVSLSEHSTPARGGAASDAMLLEATKTSGMVVYPVAVRLSTQQGPTEKSGGSLWAVVPVDAILPVIAQHAKALGHTLLLPDADQVTRRVPLHVLLGDRQLPAFALALAEEFLRSPVGQFRVPIDEHGQMLVSYVAGDRLFPSVPFLDVWAAIEGGDAEKLRQWVGGKIVLLLTSPAPVDYLTPLGPTSLQAIQTNLLNTILTQNWSVQSRPMWRLIGGLALAGLGAWLLLTLRGWQGIVAAAMLLCGYIGTVFMALAAGGILLPVFIPVTALILASAIAILWLQLSSGRRVTLLEGRIQKVQQELVAVRQALTSQESSVEVLEEDLEAARQAVARSTGKEQEMASTAQALRSQLAEAKTEEESSRQRLCQLESELRGLRASTTQPSRIGDTELERLRQECEEMGIITRDPAVLAIFRETKKTSRSTLAVLIMGEPGTGKELFARAVHRLSPRAPHPFVSVNMAAISPHLFESELFGHVRGSFTGAIGDRKGYFEQAHQGTIFLDEIGDLAMEHQGKLLRVLQEKTFYRVGATRATTVDVRIVAATNRDLERGVLEGWFREDLYFRLKGVVLRLPPLRERTPDVALLAERCLATAAAQNGRDELALSADALLALQAHPWKGNVRELEHCMQQVAVLAEGKVIMKEDLRLVTPQRHIARSLPTPFTTADSGSDEAVLTCLREEQFDMQATARALGWDRSTVTQRLKGMGFRALVESGGDRAKAAMILAGNQELVHTVELKLAEYYEHLIKTIEGFDSADEAVAACKKRYKNLPDRHFRSMETLIRQFYQRRSDSV